MWRRVATIPTLALIGSLMWIGLAVWLPLTLLVGLVRRRRFVMTRLGLFLLVYSTMELLGLAALTAAFFAGRARNAALHYRIQTWWAGSLFRAVVALLSLDIRVEGSEHASEGPYLLLMRHSSLADTLIPAAILSAPYKIRLRYVLKKELLLDPCLDVAGSRLPNHFLDRGSPSEAELNAVAALATDLGPSDAVLIYPEGTRFSEDKRERRIQTLRQRCSPHLTAALALRRTLAPKTRGVEVLRQAAPEVDVVLCSHHGLEQMTTLGEILSGDVVGRTINIRFWRLKANDIHGSVGDWLYAEWARVDEFVDSNDALAT